MPDAVTVTNPLREALAAVEHERWSNWMLYLFGRSTRNEAGDIIIPAALAERWKRQATTPYAALSEAEKDSDRLEVDVTMAVFLGTARM